MKLWNWQNPWVVGGALVATVAVVLLARASIANSVKVNLGGPWTASVTLDSRLAISVAKGDLIFLPTGGSWVSWNGGVVPANGNSLTASSTGSLVWRDAIGAQHTTMINVS
jgi:hypothetical protein